MNILLRVVSVLAVAIAALLVYAVINAATSSGGARVGVAIGYVVAAILLVSAALYLWRLASRRRRDRQAAATG